MTAQPVLTPEEIEDFLRETFEMDDQFWMEEIEMGAYIEEFANQVEALSKSGKWYTIQRDIKTGKVKARVHVASHDGKTRSCELPLRLDLRNHSPSGFEYAYSGSGPAQLALALLADALGNDELAVALHQDFKFAAVARWNAMEDHIITAETIRDVAADLRAKQEPWPDPFAAGDTDDPPGGWPEGEAVEYADPFADDGVP